jgi:hypothetical protein
MRRCILLVFLLTMGCDKLEEVELTNRTYLVNKTFSDDGTVLYEQIWLPEQREGFFTDAGFANGSGKAYSAFALVGDTILVLYRNNEHRNFRLMETVYEVRSVAENKLEICFDTPFFKDVTSTFKYNPTFYYPVD